MVPDRNVYADPARLTRPPIKRALARAAGALPDRLFLSLLYARIYGHRPDLDDPRTFDEKILWYNLNYRRPLMSTVADKYAVRGYVESRGLGRLLNDLIGVYDDVDAIDLAALPEQFVVKATHGSRMTIICRDKQALDWEKCRAEMGRWLGTNYYRLRREWAYREIKPRLICERYLENREFGELVDYKFYCFGGRPWMLFVCTGRFGPPGLRYSAYDLSWNPMPVFKGKPGTELAVEQPANLDEMTEVARELCRDFPFVRVDLYRVDGRVFFGELTFYPDAGLCPFTPPEYNEIFGEKFVLPEPTQ